MIDDHFLDPLPKQKLVRLIRKFSVLEGRQPRVMVCRRQDSDCSDKIRELSVELAGFGFDVDVGLPFESHTRVGINAIENDADILILLGLESSSKEEFTANLEEFLAEKGYSDLFIIPRSGVARIDELIKSVSNWLEETLQ